MPSERLSMRRIGELLRLKYENCLHKGECVVRAGAWLLITEVGSRSWFTKTID